jgi:ABC-type nitrate/sulfonate/bicarbonate transport system substrate-binding protein
VSSHPRISRKSALASISAALAMPSIAEAQNLHTIKAAGVPEDSATPVLWAQQSGIFRRYGIDFQLESQRSGAAITAGVIGGAYQIGKSSLAALIVAHTKNVPLVCIAPCGLYNAASPVIALLVKSDSPFKTGADLNGKTVAVSSLNDVYTLATKSWVDQNGGNSSSVKFVELPVTAVAEAVATGRIDAGGCAMPELAEALDGGRVRILAPFFSAIAPRFLVQAWFTTTDYARQNPGIVRAFAAAEREGAAYANTHHQQTVDIESKFTNIDRGTIAKMTRFTYPTSLDPKEIQPLIDVSAKYKVIPSRFDAREIIYSG